MKLQSQLSELDLSEFMACIEQESSDNQGENSDNQSDKDDEQGGGGDDGQGTDSKSDVSDGPIKGTRLGTNESKSGIEVPENSGPDIGPEPSFELKTQSAPNNEYGNSHYTKAESIGPAPSGWGAPEGTSNCTFPTLYVDGKSSANYDDVMSILSYGMSSSNEALLNLSGEADKFTKYFTKGTGAVLFGISLLDNYVNYKYYQESESRYWLNNSAIFTSFYIGGWYSIGFMLLYQVAMYETFDSKIPLNSFETINNKLIPLDNTKVKIKLRR